jgi:hypothetical protein
MNISSCRELQWTFPGSLCSPGSVYALSLCVDKLSFTVRKHLRESAYREKRFVAVGRGGGGSQFMVHGSCCFWACGETVHHGVEEWVRLGCKTLKTEEELGVPHQGHTPQCPTRPLNITPLRNSLLGRETLTQELFRAIPDPNHNTDWIEWVSALIPNLSRGEEGAGYPVSSPARFLGSGLGLSPGGLAP